MSGYYGGPANPPGYGAQNLQFYPTSYSPAAVSGHATPSQAAYGNVGGYGAPGSSSGGYGVGAASAYGAGPSGRMGEQGGLRTGWLAAFSTEGYPGEPGLLEELGINFGHIQAKTIAVLNPIQRVDQHLMDDADLGGPLLFFFLFGAFLLLGGRLHFGYIYGLAALGTILLHGVLSLMTPDDSSASAHHAHPSASAPQYGSGAAPAYPGADPGVGAAHGKKPGGGYLSSTLTLSRSSSVLGYCMIPLVATSAIGIFVTMAGPLGILITALAAVWSAVSATRIFCAVGRMSDKRGLVGYPLFLFYCCFGLLSAFSGGSGS